MKRKGILSVYGTVINLASNLSATITELKELEGDLAKKNNYPEGKPYTVVGQWLALKGEII